MKNIMKTDVLNKRAVKQSVLEANSAHPPFFNVQSKNLHSVGSITFLPSPGKKTL